MLFTELEYLGMLIISFTSSYYLVPFLRRIAEKFNILDFPNEQHKSHSTAVPYLGGIAIVIPVVALTLIGPLVSSSSELFLNNVAILIIPSLLLSLLGFIDDVSKLGAKKKFIVQILASCLVAFYLNEKGFLVTISNNTWLNYAVSILWMVGITNSFNLLDNFDGSTAGVAAISSFFLFLLSLLNSQFLIAAFSIALLGALLGFLPWNIIPARIFLGDGGALFIGMILAVLLLRFETTNENRLTAILIPVLLTAIPIIDTSVAFFGRLSRGISPFQGGRDHLSHRLLAKGLSRKRTIATLWILAFCYNLSALVLQLLPGELATIFSLGLIFSIALLIFFFLNLDSGFDFGRI